MRMNNSESCNSHRDYPNSDYANSKLSSQRRLGSKANFHLRTMAGLGPSLRWGDGVG